jgi:uncharacterized integral membrane protein
MSESVTLALVIVLAAVAGALLIVALIIAYLERRPRPPQRRWPT